MQFFLSSLAYIALICACVALWKPKIYPFRQPNRVKAGGFYMVISLVLLILSGSVVDDSEQGVYMSSTKGPEPSRIYGGVLAWEEVARETQPMPGNERERVRVVIVPKEDQAPAAHSDIVATASGVAVKVQKECEAPVVVVEMLSQYTGNALADRLLAHVVYIPDGKGYDGAGAEGPSWESCRAAVRGFSDRELEYLRVWADKHLQYQSAGGLRTQELDAVVSRSLGIQPGSLNPFANVLIEAQR